MRPLTVAAVASAFILGSAPVSEAGFCMDDTSYWFFVGMNQVRQDLEGVEPLKFNPQLLAVANFHALDAATNCETNFTADDVFRDADGDTPTDNCGSPFFPYAGLCTFAAHWWTPDRDVPIIHGNPAQARGVISWGRRVTLANPVLRSDIPEEIGIAMGLVQPWPQENLCETYRTFGFFVLGFGNTEHPNVECDDFNPRGDPIIRDPDTGDAVAIPV